MEYSFIDWKLNKAWIVEGTIFKEKVEKKDEVFFLTLVSYNLFLGKRPSSSIKYNTIALRLSVKKKKKKEGEIDYDNHTTLVLQNNLI